MEASATLLEQLNQFTRRTHTTDEVYLFDVLLCDNEIDRDQERFSLEALGQLKALLVGKTGIFDHNPSGMHQTARLFATSLETDPHRVTQAGEPYTCLKGQAYMVRTAGNQDLIREIDGGIKKEVSISCSAAAKTCSICGKEQCAHLKGRIYQGKPCHKILQQITDAYEWSFVAVPAQVHAGVTKRYGSAEPESSAAIALQKQLAAQNQLLEQVEADTRQEIIRQRYLPGADPEDPAFRMAAEKMNLQELLQYKKALRQTARYRPGSSQLRPTSAADAMAAFRLEKGGTACSTNP